MPTWIPRSIVGGVVAGMYVIFAIVVVTIDRRSRGGGWITLKGMSSYLITLPISAGCELLGWKLDYRRTSHMAMAILGSAAILYLAVAFVGWMVAAIFKRLAA
jgi:hypothetical protein